MVNAHGVMRRVLAGLTTIVIATVGLVGCGDGIPEADLVFISGSEHNHLDPQKMSWSHDIRLADCLYEPLVYFNFATYEPEPATAESWELSDDGLVYTFHLRPDAKWSNGDPVTADDFVFAWRRVMLPDLAADYTQLTFVIDGAEAFFNWRAEQLEQYAKIRATASSSNPQAGADAANAVWKLTEQKFDEMVGVRAVADHTLEVRVHQPVPYMLSMLAFTTFAPVHKASVEQGQHLDPGTGMIRMDASYWSDPSRLVTNGPYRMEQRRFKRFVHLVANEHYWNRSAMRNDSILERIVVDPAAAVAMYEAGQVDWMPNVPTADPIAYSLIAQNRSDVHLQPMAGTYFYNFNCLPKLSDGSDNPLADVRVRRALSMAIDRTELVERVTRLNQPIAKTYIPPGAVGGYEPPADQGVTFDPQAAQALLAEAGYGDGHGLTGLSILYNTGAGHEVVAQAIAAMWQEHLGISVRLEGVEVNSFKDRLKNQEYTIARASWFGDYPDPTTWLGKMHSTDLNNDCRWSNSEFDALLAKAASERDPEKRMTMLEEAEAALLRDQPMALIYQYINLYLYDPAKVDGIIDTPWHRYQLEKVKVTR